jgi:dolichol-phosphate mannosyltransferase
VSGRDVLIVVPTLDERQSISELLAGIRSHAPAADVLVVDDGSTDGTAEIVAEIGRTNPAVRLLQRGRRLGIGSAYLEAFAIGLREGYRYLVSMDGDLSHEPRYLPDLIAAAADADVAVGSRYLHGVSVVNWGLERLALSVFANFCARVTTGLPVRDCTSGFQCFRREVLERIDLAAVKSTGYSFLVELKYRAHRHGFRIREVPIIFVDRRFGSSKLGPRHVLSSAWTLVDLRFRRL